MNDEDPIRITSDEVNQVILPPAPSPSAVPNHVHRDYGSLGPATSPSASPKAGLWRRSWCYLGIAGFLGALIAWATVEPFIVSRTGGVPEEMTGIALYAIPWLVILVCLGFTVAESMVEHSPRKFVQRGAVAVVLGTGLGLALDLIASLIFQALQIRLVFGASHPLLGAMAARSVAWITFGLASGTVYGIADRSLRKTMYGILGGLCGAGLGGLLFDPISVVTEGGALSRALGFASFGVCSGIALGLVENALKDRWLYVSGGPLAGKQFILYRQNTTIGSQQSSDIYLFKDPTILPAHAVVELRGAHALLTATEPVVVNGVPTQHRPLRSGDQIQIGRYSFEYREK